MYFGVTTIFVCLLSFVFLFLYVILVLRARRLPTFGRARREVLFRDFCLEASCASSFVVVVVRCVVACALKKCRRRFDDASGVRKVNKTLALKASLSLEHEKYQRGVHKITRKGFLTVRSRHNRRASRS